MQSGSSNNPALIQKLAQWNKVNTPSNPILAASLYIEQPSGSSWQDYANATFKILDAYQTITNQPLWIDEFGKSFGQQWTSQDQRNAYQGFLGASICYRQSHYPKFAWVAGNDYPYDGKNWFGLVAGFNGIVPAMRGAWSDLSMYYNLPSCP